jgi:MoaA/NifB/PqqE/SkfB family radical SAM enzyme
MRLPDWLRVIDQAGAMGVRMVQFIGGEPTLYPDLSVLVDRALQVGAAVEVYSNLVHVTADLWKVFRQPGLSLATSYYSDDPAEHERIVGRPGAHPRTLQNIARARAQGIPLRAGLVSFGGGQRVGEAAAQLKRLGVTDARVDHVRGVGRGSAGDEPTVESLCGQCARGSLAILPSGEAFPCVFARWAEMNVGDVRQQTLEEIAAGARLAATRRRLEAAFDTRAGKCAPKTKPERCAPPCGPETNRPCIPQCPPATHPNPCGPECAPKLNGHCPPSPCNPGPCSPQPPR